MAWNRGTTTEDGRTAKRPAKTPAAVPWKGLAAGLLVVAGGAAALLLLRPDAAPAPKPESAVRKPMKELPTVDPVGKAAKPAEEAPKADEAARAARRAKLAKMTPEERINFIFEEIRRKKPIDLSPSKGKAYRTGFEQILCLMFTCELGDMPAPLPIITVRDEAHLAELLITPNDPVEGDSEEVVRAKEAVEVAKKELVKYIKEGGDATSFLQYYHDQLEQASREYRTVQKSMSEVMRNDPDIAPEYFRKVNAQLKAKGIKPIKATEKLRALAAEQGVSLED